MILFLGIQSTTSYFLASMNDEMNVIVVIEQTEEGRALVALKAGRLVLSGDDVAQQTGAAG